MTACERRRRSPSCCGRRTLDEIVGQDDLVGPEGPLRRFVENRQLTSMILWGPAGTGKTTMARILAAAAGYEMESVSAVSSGVKDVREAIARARERLGERGVRTVLFIDEVHRFNKAQQDLFSRRPRPAKSCSSARRPRTRTSR